MSQYDQTSLGDLPKAKKPSLTLAQIINMSVGFLGIQFAFGLQNANVSRIFQTLGANHPKYMSIIMMASLVFSLIVGIGFGFLPVYISLIA